MALPGDDKPIELALGPVGGQTPSLNRLVSYFVAAKRALSSTAQIWRANEIVTCAKSCIENIAALDARVKFLKSLISRKKNIHRAVRRGLETIAIGVEAEFKSTLRVLDDADARIKAAIHQLKQTNVEPSIRPVDEESITLYDFVDERSVEEMTAAFQECIDHVTDAQKNYSRSTSGLDGEIRSIASKEPTDETFVPTEDKASVAAHFYVIESHATEMATLLQSLVRHYDLCSSALRHVEGGGEVIQNVQNDLPAGLKVDGPFQASRSHPIAEHEFSELMQVLDNDALEVDDVIQEIRDRSLEIQTELEQIQGEESSLETKRSAFVRINDLTERLDQNINDYVNAGSTFAQRWADIKSRIEERLEDLEQLQNFYAGFFRAYQGLLVEIGRRRSLHEKMEKIAENCASKLEGLEKQDLEDREAFTLEHGEFLPLNIWPGLVQSPSKFQMKREDANPEIPSITPEILNRAWTLLDGKSGSA